MHDDVGVRRQLAVVGRSNVGKDCLGTGRGSLWWMRHGIDSHSWGTAPSGNGKRERAAVTQYGCE
jgi:hypothetical protein